MFELPEINLADAVAKPVAVSSVLTQWLDSGLQVAEVPLKDKLKGTLKELEAKQQLFIDEAERIREEARRAILKLNDDRTIISDEIRELQRQIREEELAEAERLRLQRELEAKKSEAERLDALSQELALICENFPSYFQARVYQHDDILFTVNAYRENLNGILNANDMSLGKTFETIVSLYVLNAIFISENGRKPRILWLTKKSLVTSSPKEIRHWWPGCMVIAPTPKISTPADRKFLVELYDSGADIFLCNYEYVRTTPKMREKKWDFIVIDEVHKLKGGANSNGPTGIWTACKEICSEARFNFFLSGTPMVNKPEEMWSYLHIFKPDRFPNLRHFERQFLSYKYVAGEQKIEVDVNRILSAGLKGQMIRRTKAEVGIQIPEHQWIIVNLEMNADQLACYVQMRDKFFIWLDKQGEVPLAAGAIIAQLTRLRQINSWPAGIVITDPLNPSSEIRLEVPDSSKVDEAMDIITELGDQCVVFCTFNEPLAEIQRRVIKEGITCNTINGTNSMQTGEIETAFQQGELQVLCLNSAVAEGLNLHKNPERWPGGCNTGIFLDKWWSPARQEQGYGRYHRPGQTHACTSYYLRNENSVDAYIDLKNEEKMEAFAGIMDSQEIRPGTEWRSFLEGVL